MKLTSPVFAEGHPVPAKFTCDGANISPPLQWSGVPPNTESFALICDDPDAPQGTWVHWVLYNLPASLRELPGNADSGVELPNGAKQGVTDFKRPGYGGPCPPPGGVHHYYFKLYSLDTGLTLKLRATKKDLVDAMKGHVLAEASLMGLYQRRRG